MKIDRTSTIDKNILLEKNIYIPISYDSNDFIKSMRKALNNYINILKSYKVNNYIINIINNQNDSIISLFKEYYRGYHNKAYKIFKKLMRYVRANNELIIDKNPEGEYYRARVNINNIDYSNNQMYHIPFDSRGLVSSQRYSFPGLPCLYLCSSSYTCWVELNRPPFNQFQVALLRFNKKRNYKVIDLSLHPYNFYNKLTDDNNSYYLPDYLCMWPIIAMCSIKVRNENDIFKPEYIFPQFMLQYVLEEKGEINGIKYMSVKINSISKEQYKTNPKTYINYVFPVKDSKQSKDHLSKDLLDKFSIVNNFSGKELEILSDMIKKPGFSWGPNTKGEIVIPADKNEAIYNSKGFPFAYDKSIFRRIENILSNKYEIKNK